MKILGTICARGGSKGIKNKNIRLLNNKPLIAYSIEALKSWGKADRIICSTDSDEIQKIARQYGAETPFKRPAELATDTAGKLDVIKHLVNFCENQDKLKYDYIVDLDPTSPLRSIKDIEESFSNIQKSDSDLIFSVYEAHKNPYFNMVELDNLGYAHLCKSLSKTILTRQKAPKVYSMNASIYIYKRDFLINTSSLFAGKCIIHEMPTYSIDIDDQSDFDFIEYLIHKGGFKFDN